MNIKLVCVVYMLLTMYNAEPNHTQKLHNVALIAGCQVSVYIIAVVPVCLYILTSTTQPQTNVSHHSTGIFREEESLHCLTR